MRKIVAITTMMLSASAFADPTIFKMQLGKTTESELKRIYHVKHIGTNKYSNGNMYTVPTSAINFEGIQEVTTIFDTKGVLAAVITTLPKAKFDYLNKTLGSKYKRINQDIPFVGNKSVTYQSGNTKITLEAPHLSFQLSMNYIRNDLMKKFNKKSQADKRNKQKNEASQL